VKWDRLLEKDIVIGDGANGTLLAAAGYPKQPYDLANLEAPELVLKVHRDYFEAGSDFVETNTFESNRIRLGDYPVDIRELNLAGARLAREAAGVQGVVLGAIGPCGKPIEPIGTVTAEDVGASVREQALALADGDIDGFILETYTNLEELIIAFRSVRDVSDLPILVSRAYIEDGEMLAEGLPGRCTQALAELGVAAVGANCIVGPQRMLDLVRQMAESTDLPILAFPTPGMPQLVKGQVTYDATPDYFAKAVVRLAEAGAKIVGGCCGTTPGHIRALKSLLDGGKVRLKPKVQSNGIEKPKKPLEVSEPSELAQKLGRKFVVAVEMDVPRGLNIDRIVAGARALKISGADVINISDGARARLRMNPSAVSSIIQSRVGIEVTMHFSCRDRNLLAIQSDLLGCHAMGIRNILAVTGDPANIGDYPSATSVFDIDAVGLCRILSRFNEGVDLAGYSVGVKCGFTIACAYNPMAGDADLEFDRLKRKVDAGAKLVYTQPLFGGEAVESALEACRQVGVPCLVGLLPLRSARHTEFMHNEVPGIDIPEGLRQRMNDAPDDPTALEIGIEEAQGLAVLAKQSAAGLYLMPPFGSHSIAQRVMESVIA
jgi:homocysteine S-methyltransferase